ncbi:MAG: DUF1343 domain-containing protein, partial [Flavobacteriales bacterium]
MIDFKPFKSTYLILFLLLNFQLISCAQKTQNKDSKFQIQNSEKEDVSIKTGAERTDLYVELLKGKKVAVVGNQTSIIEKRGKNKEKRDFIHIVDSLIS